jgi:hypothetical protein
VKQLRHIFIIGAGVIAISAHGESFQAVRPKGQPPYANISFVAEGPPIVVGQRVVRGKFHRITVIDSGIAYEAPILRFDTLTYGDEACCRRVVASFELRLSTVIEKLNPSIHAEYTRFKLRRWDGPTSLQFSYGDASYSVRGIGTSAVAVEPVK